MATSAAGSLGTGSSLSFSQLVNNTSEQRILKKKSYLMFFIFEIITN